MARAVSERLTQVLLAAAIVALLAIQVAIKPGFDPAAIRAAAESYGGPSKWIERRAQDFDLPLRDGSTFRLADHVGRDIIVLNFFATWCAPCREEMPELQRYVDDLNNTSSHVILLGVDVEEPPDTVDAFVRRLGISFPVGIDDTGALARTFGVEAFPTSVVIGADGRIKLHQSGAISNTDVAFGAIVPRELLALTTTRQPPARAGFVAPADSPSHVAELTGRALAIAQAMPCPCGCDGMRVITCECQTAKRIRTRLGAGVDSALSDGKVMEALNKAFCMKGM
jgi:peroxiredoxin